MINQNEKIILGIDPGTARMGYGVLRYKNPQLECIDYGVIATEAKEDSHKRLQTIYTKLNELVSKYSPDAFGVEDIFYFKNQKTLVDVSQARGIALLVAAQAGKPCHSFTPLQVKQAITGYGKAEKKQVQLMTQKVLGLDSVPKPDDAADALAVAVCCAHSLDILQKYGK